jgi:2'-5' RNA ligase
MYRIFTGLKFSNTVRERICALYYGIPHILWVPNEQLHLTLRFIGNVDGGTLEDIADSLKQISFNSFILNLKHIGFFPLRGQPKILWVGVENTEFLINLQKKIDRVITQLRIPPEPRKFHPHVTIARLKQVSKPKLGEFLMKNSLFEINNLKVDEFILYRSFLSEKGSIYQELASFPLIQE